MFRWAAGGSGSGRRGGGWHLGLCRGGYRAGGSRGGQGGLGDQLERGPQGGGRGRRGGERAATGRPGGRLISPEAEACSVGPVRRSCSKAGIEPALFRYSVASSPAFGASGFHGPSAGA
ncbi:MAG: hypothetical protein M3P70_15050 [Actinomycetota bacterium]|nr:hypothetical protein [Actinomycetota bacterium]